jgi:tRNA1(Val) A37 N6-methylase TrmN6
MSAQNPIHVLGKKLELQQIEGGFRTSLDSVFLSAACKAQEGEHILDMGCGIGSAGLCVLARVSGAKLTGLDIQDDHVAIAIKNAAVNGLEKSCQFIEADIRDFEAAERFDHVICNPPYLEAGSHLVSPSEAKAKAMGHEGADMDVQDWVKAGLRNLKSGGTLTMVHRADRTDKIIRSMGKSFGAVEIIPLWPKAGVDAKRVIIRAIKDRKSPARLHAGIVLHTAEGGYTKEADAILRGEQIIE